MRDEPAYSSAFVLSHKRKRLTVEQLERLEVGESQACPTLSGRKTRNQLGGFTAYGNSANLR